MFESLDKNGNSYFITLFFITNPQIKILYINTPPEICGATTKQRLGRREDNIEKDTIGRITKQRLGRKEDNKEEDTIGRITKQWLGRREDNIERETIG